MRYEEERSIAGCRKNCKENTHTTIPHSWCTEEIFEYT